MNQNLLFLRMKMNGLLRKLSFIFLLLLFAAYVNGQTVTTDKVDYMPGDKIFSTAS